MINPDRLTVKSAEAFNEAVNLARKNGNPLVYDLHLFDALVRQDEGVVAPILQKLGVAIPTVAAQIEREIARYPKQSGAQPSVSRELNQIFDRAEEEAVVRRTGARPRTSPRAATHSRAAPGG